MSWILVLPTLGSVVLLGSSHIVMRSLKIHKSKWDPKSQPTEVPITRSLVTNSPCDEQAGGPQNRDWQCLPMKHKEATGKTACIHSPVGKEGHLCNSR